MNDSTHHTPPSGTAAGLAPPSRAASQDWLRQRMRAARRAAVPAVALGLLGTMAGIGQAACAGLALQAGLAGAGLAAAVLPLAVFAGLAVLRAGLVVWFERAGFNAGAAARRRLRSEALGRILAAGPALLRRQHSADLAAVVVDRVEALDGLFARWIPAALLAFECQSYYKKIVMLMKQITKRESWKILK